MEDPNPQTGRIGRRQRRELTVQRRFEMERVEGTLLAAAYETVWPPTASRKCDRPYLHRSADAAGRGSMAATAHALGRRGGPSSLVAMGG